MARRSESPQLDLFEGAPLQPEFTLASALRISALEQLQALLMEATTISADVREAGDDQNQA